jgi:malate dehydrogenase (oxaloacetate-decarboxylating)
LALGIVASKANRVTDTMIKAAADELVNCFPREKQGSLLPPIGEVRTLSRSIAQAVGKQALADGQAQVANEVQLDRAISENFWEPVYRSYERR